MALTMVRCRVLRGVIQPVNWPNAVIALSLVNRGSGYILEKMERETGSTPPASSLANRS